MRWNQLNYWINGFREAIVVWYWL